MTSENILATKLLIRPFKVEEKKTNSGIIIPGIGKTTQCGGDVILVGKGTPTVEMPVKVGQKVLCNPHSLQSVIIEEEQMALLDIRDALYFY
jgi:co-chaperonin GroES (HSP10)